MKIKALKWNAENMGNDEVRYGLVTNALLFAEIAIWGTPAGFFVMGLTEHVYMFKNNPIPYNGFGEYANFDEAEQAVIDFIKKYIELLTNEFVE